MLIDAKKIKNPIDQMYNNTSVLIDTFSNALIAFDDKYLILINNTELSQIDYNKINNEAILLSYYYTILNSCILQMSMFFLFNECKNEQDINKTDLYFTELADFKNLDDVKFFDIKKFTALKSDILSMYDRVKRVAKWQ